MSNQDWAFLAGQETYFSGTSNNQYLESRNLDQITYFSHQICFIVTMNWVSGEPSQLNEFTNLPLLCSQAEDYDGGLMDQGGEVKFEIQKKVEFGKRMLVFGHSMANTFFHKMEPTMSVKIHLPPSRRTSWVKKIWWGRISEVAMEGRWPFLVVVLTLFSCGLFTSLSFF